MWAEAVRAGSTSDVTPDVSPVVSVVIPAHNAAATLGRTLESLLRQTLSEWEAVVVDDGSTDETWGEIELWMARDQRIRGIRLHRNMQAPTASNYALAAARGKWIAVVDADDWIVPTRLEHLVAHAEATWCDVVADNQILYDAQAAAAVGTVLSVDRAPHRLSLRQFLARSITGVSRFDHGMLKPLVRRAFLEQAGVRYEPGCMHGYDFHFMLDLLAAGARALVVHEPLYVYVQPYGSLSRRLSHEGRTRYRYDVMRQYTDASIEHYQTTLDRGALRCLRRRSRAIARFAAYLEFKAALAEGALPRALAAFGRNPACVHPAVASLMMHLGVVKRTFPLPREWSEVQQPEFRHR